MCPGQRIVGVGTVGMGIGGWARQLELVNDVGRFDERHSSNFVDIVRQVKLVKPDVGCLTSADSTHICGGLFVKLV